MIVSCGDSFFYGIDLSDCVFTTDPTHPCYILKPSKKTWPALIAQQLDLSYQSFAEPGVGNLQILKQIIQAISQYKNNVFYFINWTWIDRFDYVNAEDEKWSTIRPISDKFGKNDLYYRNFHSEIVDKFSSLVYIDQSISLLKSHDCRYIMTYMDRLLLDQQWHAPGYVKLLQDRIQNHLQDFNGKTFLEWSRDNKYPESAHWHPLEQAHESAAIYWLPKVESLILLIVP